MATKFQIFAAYSKHPIDDTLYDTRDAANTEVLAIAAKNNRSYWHYCVDAVEVPDGVAAAVIAPPGVTVETKPLLVDEAIAQFPKVDFSPGVSPFRVVEEYAGDPVPVAAEPVLLGGVEQQPFTLTSTRKNEARARHKARMRLLDLITKVDQREISSLTHSYIMLFDVEKKDV